jgi:hypothetical protein
MRYNNIAESLEWLDCNLDNRGVRVRFLDTDRELPRLDSAETSSGAQQPPRQWDPDGPSLRLKQPERESSYLPPSIADVKNTRIYTYTPHTIFLKSSLIKSRNNFTFTLHRLRVSDGFIERHVANGDVFSVAFVAVPFNDSVRTCNSIRRVWICC